MVYGWMETHKENEKWIWRIPLPHPPHIPNLPSNAKAKPALRPQEKSPASDRFAFRFFFPSCSFLFPLALFFKVTWAQTQCSGSSDSQRISNYHGKPSFYVWVYLKRRPVEIHNEFILNKPTVTGRAQFEESEYWYKKLLETYHCMSQVAVWKNIKYWI